jgi:tetratricopeptide (TPR) repeat protein
MDDRLYFRYSLPQPPAGPVIEVSAAEAEKLLLRKLDAKTNPIPVLWELAQLHKNAGHHEKALEYLRRLMELLPNVEEKANCVFTMGQAMENVGDYPAAVRYYREALSLEPTNTFVWYFINNNLGFSLNTLGQFADGEVYCRKAIEIDVNRPNGHKNLGISLEGQGRYAEAARCFVAATQVNAADPRAFQLLEKLLQGHPELQYEFQSDADCCREAIRIAHQKALSLRPTVRRGLRKRLVLIRLMAGWMWARWRKWLLKGGVRPSRAQRCRIFR